MDLDFGSGASAFLSSLPWAVAAVAIAFFFFRYLTSTSQLRFEAKEAKASRDEAARAQSREDRLRQEEKSAAINAERRALERQDNLAEAEAERVRLAALREEAKADSAGNAACVGEATRILGEADAILVKICRYYEICDESVDPDEDEPDDPYVNLVGMKDKIKESYDAALDFFDEAQDMVKEGLYIVAKQRAEACLIEAKYACDRIVSLDTAQWNKVQAAER